MLRGHMVSETLEPLKTGVHKVQIINIGGSEVEAKGKAPKHNVVVADLKIEDKDGNIFDKKAAKLGAMNFEYTYPMDHEDTAKRGTTIIIDQGIRQIGHIGTQLGFYASEDKQAQFDAGDIAEKAIGQNCFVSYYFNKAGFPMYDFHPTSVGLFDTEEEETFEEVPLFE